MADVKTTLATNNNMVPLNAAVLSAKFPSLILSPPVPLLLGLYFAASWCPDCTPVTPKIQQCYQSQQTTTTTTESELLHLVYVSSDDNEEQMKRSIGDSLAYIPFDRTEERAELKRHFGTCAAKERTTLGMTPEQRRHGIPTLIVLETASGRIITEDGVNDVVQGGALEKWKSMLSSD